MNVTIKISDEICRDARHRAVDAGRSLSGWVEEIIRKELSRTGPRERQTLLEALGNDRLSGADVDFPRDKSPAREVDFS
jgi:plasmid stability protein